MSTDVKVDKHRLCIQVRLPPSPHGSAPDFIWHPSPLWGDDAADFYAVFMAKTDIKPLITWLIAVSKEERDAKSETSSSFGDVSFPATTEAYPEFPCDWFLDMFKDVTLGKHSEVKPELHSVQCTNCNDWIYRDAPCYIRYGHETTPAESRTGHLGVFYFCNRKCVAEADSYDCDGA